MDCPLSNVGLDGVTDPDDRAGLSVSVPDFMLLVVSGVVALSFISIFAFTVFPVSALGKAHAKEFEVVDIPVYNAFASCEPVIVFTTIQFAVQVDVPPDQLDEKVILCPQSNVSADVGLIDGVPKAAFTVTRSVPDVTVTGVVALSVTS